MHQPTDYLFDAVHLRHGRAPMAVRRVAWATADSKFSSRATIARPPANHGGFVVERHGDLRFPHVPAIHFGGQL